MTSAHPRRTRALFSILAVAATAAVLVPVATWSYGAGQRVTSASLSYNGQLGL
jgi:hypothetical protein